MFKVAKILIVIAAAWLCVASSSFVACTPEGNTPDGSTTDGGTSDDGTSDGSTTSFSYNACTDDKKIGEFRIELSKDFTGVQGQLFTGVTPQNVPEEVATEGGCRLVKNKQLFCDPACKPGESCDESGKCITSPTGLDVGQIEVTGLKAAVSMSPRAPIFFYTFTGTMPHPGFAPGDSIQLKAAGGVEDAFTLRGFGVDPLVVDNGGAAEIEVTKDQNVDLKWSPPTKSDSPTKVTIRLNINNHGGAASWITCEVDDNGAFSIPAGLVTKMFDAGSSGFPDIQFSRRSADSVTLKAGCAQLIVVSNASLPVKVPGLTSCSDDKDCASGKTCQADLTCSE